MVLRLQTKEDQIKTYQTINNIYGTQDFTPIICFTKCGLDSRFPPKLNEGCGHLECAIFSAKRDKKQYSAAVILLITIIIISFIYSWKVPGSDIDTFFLLFFTPVAFAGYINGYRSGKRLNELTEYKDKGTINGIKACQTDRFPEPYQEFFQELERAIDIVGNWRSKGIAGRFLAAISAIFFIITVVAELKGIIEPVIYTFTISVISAFLAISFLRWDVNIKTV